MMKKIIVFVFARVVSVMAMAQTKKKTRRRNVCATCFKNHESIQSAMHSD